MSLLLVSFVAALAPQSPIQLRQVQNGGFDDVVGGVASTLWCGGEGKVQSAGGVSYVVVGRPDRVFQGVAKPRQSPTDLAISLQVRLPQSGNVGRVTISEGSDRFDVLTHQLSHPETAGIAAPWTAYEQGASWQAMAFQPFGPKHWGFVSTGSLGQEISLNPMVLTDTIQLEYDVPTPGDVVWMVRPVLVEGAGPVEVQVLKDPDGTLGAIAPTLLSSFTLGTGAPDGADLTGDVTVDATDTVLFRYRNLAGPSNPARVVCRPAVRYTTQRVTYVLSDAPPTISPAPLEHVITPPGIVAGTWNAVPLLFESDFFAAFGAAPKPPFLIELRGYGGGVAHFTDVDVTHQRTVEDYASLRADLLGETERIVQSYQQSYPGYPLGLRDDQGLPTPWQLYAMNPNAPPFGGPESIVANGVMVPYGSVPSNLRHLLKVRYSPKEYDDLRYVVQATFSPANKATLFFPRYDCVQDQFVQGATETTGIGQGALALEMYRHTHDVTFLEAARDYAHVVAARGKIDATVPPANVPDIRNGLLLMEGYDVATGVNSFVTSPNLAPWRILDAPAFLAEVIGAMLSYEQADPGKLDLSGLPLITAAARDAIERANFLRIIDIPDNTHHGFGAPWWSIAYFYSDIYGYAGIAATKALDAITPFADPIAQPLLHQMRLELLEFLGDGAVAFLDSWELNTARNAPNAGDQWRAWEPIVWLIQNEPALLDVPRTRTQLLRVARRLAAYQMPEGVWVNCNENEFYLVDIAEGASTPLYAPTFYEAFSELIVADPTNTALRDEMLTRLRDKFDVSFDWFVTDPGFPFGYKPDYYGTSGQKMTEVRLVDNYLECLQRLDLLYGFGQGAPLPTVAISPRDYTPTPPPNRHSFRFTITAPPGESVQAVLANTHVRLHRLTAGVWPEPGIDLWPNAGSNGSWTIGINGQTATVRFTPAAPLSGEFKFELLSALPDGRWACTTSYQNW